MDPNESRGDVFAERLLVVLFNPWFLAAAFAVILLIVSFELSVNVDETIWAYSGWLWAVYHDPPYVGAFENKPPGIFLLHRLAYSMFGQSIWPVRVLGIAAAIGTMFLLRAVGRRYGGKLAGDMSALVFVLATTTRTADGSKLATTETFVAFFAALAFALLSSASREKSEASSMAFHAGSRRGPGRGA